MEVSSHALDQGRVAGLTFEAGVFTNLTQDHLDYHKTMQNYLLAKRKLFEQSKYAVLNLDDPYGMKIAAGLSCRKITSPSVPATPITLRIPSPPTRRELILT